jgi:hypothetical protein
MESTPIAVPIEHIAQEFGRSVSAIEEAISELGYLTGPNIGGGMYALLCKHFAETATEPPEGEPEPDDDGEPAIEATAACSKGESRSLYSKVVIVAQLPHFQAEEIEGVLSEVGSCGESGAGIALFNFSDVRDALVRRHGNKKFSPPDRSSSRRNRAATLEESNS